MSQVIFDTIDSSTTSGNQLAQILNDFKDAMISGSSGTSRPSQIDPGGCWIDTSLQGSLNVWDFKVFTGSSDITVFRLNLGTGTPSISGSDNTFEVTRISADSVGPLFKLIKERIANNGQTLFGDSLGEIQFLGTADDLTNPVSVKIRAIATDDYTSSEQGAALIFEVVNIDTNVLSEFMRIAGDKLGIGLINPSEKLHVRGNLKVDRVTDDAVPAKSILKKSRIAGSGQVLLNDVIAEESFRSTDETGSEIEVARIQVVATENHTTANQGTKLVISTKNNTTNTFVEKIIVDSSGVSVDGVSVNSSTVQLKSEKNAANGYAGLDATGKVAAAQLPSYVDDVEEYANLAAFPITGETGKIYVALDTGLVYRWSGSIYINIGQEVTQAELDAAIASANNQSVVNSLIFG
jgi:hypothetical protein